MSASSAHRVELVQDNITLRRLMYDILRGADFQPCQKPDATTADLLIVDVDPASRETEQRRDAYQQTDRPVVVSGIGKPRETRAGEQWLERPFDGEELVAVCREALDLAAPEEAGADEPEGSPTREVDYGTSGSPEGDDSEVAEAGTGLDAETAVETEGPPASDESEVVEIDDASSMVVDVREIDEPLSGGGTREGEVDVRELEVETLYREAADLEPFTESDDSKASPTLPDVPTSKEGSGEGLESNSNPPVAASTGAHRQRSAGSNPVEPDSVAGTRHVGPTGGERPRADAGGGQRTGDAGSGPPSPVAPAFRRDLKELATRLADSWSQIGLAARREDRADRLDRTFEALIERGFSGACRELERVPPADGFSGTIDVFSVFELIQVIQSREFLGRLEISNQSGGYVLYLDGPRLVGIDDLEGRSDAMLLDCLREGEAIGEADYERLARTLDESLTTSLEMRLRSDESVSEQALIEARRTRASWVVKEVLGADTGTFAFIAGNDESGQPWPVDELGVRFDAVALELFRDGSCQPPLTELDAGTTVVAVPMKAREIDEKELTPVEAETLEVCRAPCEVGRLADSVEMADREAAAVVGRLEAVGLVQKLAGGGADADQTAEVEAINPADGSASEDSTY